MKTGMYYFTGTGNSLAVAEGLSRVLGDCEMAPITRAPEDGGTIKPGADRVGIVCPVVLLRASRPRRGLCGTARCHRDPLCLCRRHHGRLRGFGGPPAARRDPAEEGGRGRKGARHRVHGEDARELHPDVRVTGWQQAGADPRGGRPAGEGDRRQGEPEPSCEAPMVGHRIARASPDVPTVYQRGA